MALKIGRINGQFIQKDDEPCVEYVVIDFSPFDQIKQLLSNVEVKFIVLTIFIVVPNAKVMQNYLLFIRKCVHGRVMYNKFTVTETRTLLGVGQMADELPLDFHIYLVIVVRKLVCRKLMASSIIYNAKKSFH